MAEFRDMIKDFPASWFSASMGTGVFATATYLMAQFYKSPKILNFFILSSRALVFLNFVLFFVLLVPFSARLIFYFNSMRKDFENPVKANFYVTLGIALLTLASNFSIVQPIYSLYLIFWLSGSIFVIVMELAIMAISFIGTKVEIKHINPSWFLGATGLLLIPGTGYIIVHDPSLCNFSLFLFDISFGTGFFLYISLFSIWLYRFLLYRPMRRELIPLFWINLGPVGAFLTSTMVYYSLIPSLTPVVYFFALLFFGIGAWWFFLTIIVTLYYLKNLKIPYRTVWWSFTFPLGQFLIGAIYFNSYFSHTGNLIFIFSLYILLVFLWIINVSLTLYSIICGEIVKIQKI